MDYPNGVMWLKKEDVVFWILFIIIFSICFISVYIDYLFVNGAGDCFVFSGNFTLHMFLEIFAIMLVPFLAYYGDLKISFKKVFCIICLAILGDWLLNYYYYKSLEGMVIPLLFWSFGCIFSLITGQLVTLHLRRGEKLEKN